MAAKGADILIHEAQNAQMTAMMVQGLKAMGNPRMASIMADTVSYHTTPVEAADIARAAGARAAGVQGLLRGPLLLLLP